MAFTKRDKDGKLIRNNVVIDCSNDDCYVEQNHLPEVEINNIVKRHGMDLIAKVNALQEFTYDDVTGNDFQESMNALIRARDTFESVPNHIRKHFDHDAAAFMDFVHNPENNEQLIEWGLANAPAEAPAPIEVIVTNPVETPETPPQ